MTGLLQNKLMLFVLLGILVAGVVWYGFLGGTSDEQLLTTEDVLTTNEADSEVVRVLLTLRAVSLAGTIFADPAFQSLEDFGREITQEPIGRRNPFAPLEFAAPPEQQEIPPPEVQ